MKQRVSRRNGRTASARARSIRDAAILAVSLIVFLGGAGGLAWALHADPAQDGNTSPPSRPTAQSEQSDPYAGIIISAPGDDTLVGEDATSKTSVSKYVEDALATDSAKAEELERERELAMLLRETVHPHTDTRLRMALASLKSYLENPPEGTQEPDLRASAILRCLSDHLPKPASKASKKTASRLRHA